MIIYPPYGGFFLAIGTEKMTDSIQKIPVFGVGFNPAPLTLEGCSGWAENEDEALKIVQGLLETTELVTIMSHQFGVEYRLAGVKRERIVIKDDEGQHYNSLFGRHRYQEVFRAFLERSHS